MEEYIISEKQKDAEELIFKLYKKYLLETYEGRQKDIKMQLCTKIYNWCRDYSKYKKEIDDMGVELLGGIDRMLKLDIKSQTAKDKTHLLNYLRTVIDSAFKQSRRNPHSENNMQKVKYPRIINYMENSIMSQEVESGRKMNDLEKIQLIQKMYNKTENSARNYLDMIKSKNEGHIIPYNENDETASNNSVNKTENDFYEHINNIVLEAAISVLNNKKIVRKKTKPCYIALFTVQCIDKKFDLEKLSPVLDAEIIENYIKNKIMPTQSEAYQKFHNVKKTSAEGRASTMIGDFYGNLLEEIKRKHPETAEKIKKILETSSLLHTAT